jgi:DNA polymerase III delta prime subunit
MTSDFLFTERYRPKTIDDCILPDDVKKTFKDFVKKGEIPNLLLSGPPGIGKTTVAKALCNELGADFYIINGSDEGRFLDTVRNQAKNFASTVSLTGSSKHKVIIVDESDNTTSDVQMLLRANIEAFYNNCRFIFTCNYKNKIIEPLHSRCAVVDFTIKGKQKAQLAGFFFERLQKILDEEKIKYNKSVLAELTKKFFPDFRRILNECQRYSTGGEIDTGILSSFSDVSVNELIKNLKTKQFMEVRKWVVSNLDNDINFILRKIYDSVYDNLIPSSIPQAILILAKYQYQSAFCVDQEINLLACLTELMSDCNFK